MSIFNPDDPEFRALFSTAISDPRACPVLLDWLQEYASEEDICKLCLFTLWKCGVSDADFAIALIREVNDRLTLAQTPVPLPAPTLSPVSVLSPGVFRS